MKRYEFEMVTTRNGDRGTSTDFSGNSMSKGDLLFEVNGQLDELSSWLGKCKHCFPTDGDSVINLIRYSLKDLQLWLQWGGSLISTDPKFNYEISTQPTNPAYDKLTKITDKEIEEIEKNEKWLLSQGVVIQPNFILPGGTPASADIDIARTVCRRAERTLVRFMTANPGRHDLKNLSILLNRMSDFLFILARFEEQHQ